MIQNKIYKKIVSSEYFDNIINSIDDNFLRHLKLINIKA